MKSKSQSRRGCRNILRFARTMGMVALAGTASMAPAQTGVTLLSSDAVSTSSFTGATNWSDGLSPFSGNAYFTTNFTLRTPTGSGSYIFAGDSLSIDPFSTNVTVAGTGTLSMKGSGLITVSNLLLNGGIIVNNGTGGSPDTALLAGNITVAVNSTLDGGNSNGVSGTSLNILAPMTGAGGISVLDYGTVLFSASNSYTGQTTVGNNSGTTGGVLKINNSNAIPVSLNSGDNIGNLRVNFTTTNAANVGSIFDLNGFDVAVNQFITGTSNANTIAPQIINSAAGKTNTLTVGLGDGNGFTWRGSIRDNLGTGGVVAFTKVGSGTFALSTTIGQLSYSGDTTFGGGQVNLGASLILPFGPGKGNLNVNSPGILNLNGRSEVVNGLSGDGIIDDTGTTGRSTLGCGSNDVSSTFSGVLRNSQVNLPANQSVVSLTKWGAGTVALTGDNTFNGPVVINAGALRITRQNGDGSSGGGLGLGPKTNSITSAMGDAQLHLYGTNGDITVDASIAFLTAGANGAIVNDAGDNAIYGQIMLNTGGSTRIRVDGGTLALMGNINLFTNITSRTLTLDGTNNGTVGGVISDGSSASIPNTNILSLTKSGAGVWTFTTNNIYSGATIINGGTLLLAVNGSISNTPSLTLQSNATLDVSAVAGWTLLAGQVLSGSGNVTGNVTASGTISPGGAATIGALVFSDQLTLANLTLLKLNRTNSFANADQITAATLVRGGTLTVTNTGDPLQAGDTFTLFSTASASGLFSTTNLPALSAGLYWTNTLALNGKLTVLSTVVPQPHITSVSLSGTNLVISGTNGLAGEQYNVLTSTNLALPLANWMVLPTNTFSSGIFSITNPVNPNTPQNFYMLRVL